MIRKERDVNSLVSKVRNDNLRNDIVHGRTNDVSLEIINKSLDSIMALQDCFKNIENELLKIFWRSSRECKEEVKKYLSYRNLSTINMISLNNLKTLKYKKK